MRGSSPGRKPDPLPWHAFSYAPLIEVARACAAAGAEVYNLSFDREQAAWGEEETGLVFVTSYQDERRLPSARHREPT